MKIELPHFKQQQDFTCVPACIRITLRYFGLDLSESDIIVACKTTDRGTDQDEAAQGIAKLGFKAVKLEDTTLNELIDFIRQGRPVTVFLSVQHLPYGSTAGMHAVVLNGFVDDTVSFVDPARGEEIGISIDTFLNAWDERGRLGLVIEI